MHFVIILMAKCVISLTGLIILALLQDQFDNVVAHTQKGTEFCERLLHFVKEKCAIETEYATKLKWVK